MKILRVLICLFSLLFCCNTIAAAGYRYIVIRTAMDSDITVSISSDLTTYFDDTDIIFSSDNFYLALPISMVKGWTYRAKDSVSSVDDPAADGVAIANNRDSITLHGLPDNSTVIMADLGGRTLLNRQVSGDLTVSLDGLADGIYIIAVNGQTFKFTVSR